MDCFDCAEDVGGSALTIAVVVAGGGVCSPADEGGWSLWEYVEYETLMSCVVLPITL